MNIEQLIHHPEQLNKESLYDLRSLLALHPYYQPARLLLLQNLYILHDPTFDEELRRAALYITDRRVLFQLVEAAHYKLRKTTSLTTEEKATDTNNRTVSLIDSFLQSIPDESRQQQGKRRPTPADATIDYVAYLLDVEQEQAETGNREQETAENNDGNSITENPAESAGKGEGASRTVSLIDNFINKDGGSFILQETPEYTPELNESAADDDSDTGDEYFTETLARIYIQQGRYSKALEIITRLNLLYPKKNRYFADQIRFLEKLMINNNKK